MFDGTQINYFVAFAAGLITFFASCLLPLVPIYLAYLSGISLQESGAKEKRWPTFEHSLLFVTGFVLVFMALGATASTVGNAMAVYKPVMQKVGGVFFIFLGLVMLGYIRFDWLYQERKVTVPSWMRQWPRVRSLLTGMTFGFAWTPCIGPVLAAILFWAAQAESAWYGSSLLLVYGLGLGLPFLVIGMFFEQLAPKLSKAGRWGHWLHQLAGWIIILAGILMLFDRLQYFSVVLLDSLQLRTLAV